MSLYVNGQAVDPQQIEQEKERMRPSYIRTFADQPAEQQETQLCEWARENVIESILFRQAAIEKFPTITDTEIDAFLNHILGQEDESGPLHQRLGSGDAERQKLRQEAAEQIRTERLLTMITASVAEPNDKEIRRYYERHLERFTVPEMLRAAHIVKHPTPDMPADMQKHQMDEIMVQLQAGAEFAEMVGKHSACPDSGGDLGYFARGQMVPAFEDVVFGLELGQISGVFATEFGWHIAKVLDRKPSMPCPLEQVRQVIIKELTQQARDKAVEQFLDQQRQKAVVEER